MRPTRTEESAGSALNRHEQAVDQNAGATQEGHLEMPACRKLASARAVALAMATLGASSFDEFPVEQNQTKRLSCPSVLFRLARKTTHGKGEWNAFFQ